MIERYRQFAAFALLAVVAAWLIRCLSALQKISRLLWVESAVSADGGEWLLTVRSGRLVTVGERQLMAQLDRMMAAAI